MLKLHDLDSKLRERIQRQLAQEDAARLPVAGLGSAKPEPDRRREGQNKRVEGGTAGFRYVIGIVAHRKRKMDGHDNLRSAHKALVDRITERLGFTSDDDPRLEWEYAQVIKRGRAGTHLTITATNHEPNS
jgi:hypothetical protein